MPDPALTQPGDDSLDLRPQRRPQLQRAAEPVVDRDHDHGVAVLVDGGELAVDRGRDRNALHLQVTATADPDGAAVDADTNAITDLVLGVVGSGQLES